MRGGFILVVTEGVKPDSKDRIIFDNI